MKPLKGIMALVVCLIILFAATAILNKPTISQYEGDFGFSLKNIDVRITDHYHKSHFRDSVALYRVSVKGDTTGTIFDSENMSDGLSPETETMFDMAIESAKDDKKFADLISINKEKCKSIILKEESGSAKFCVIDYGAEDQFLVIWVG